MGWDYRADENGRLEILVGRWDTLGKGGKEVLLVAEGFEPNEPLQVEVFAKEE